MTNLKFLIAALAVISSTTAIAENCLSATCRVGDSVTTLHKKNDWGYVCPTKELAEYASFIKGVWAFQAGTLGMRPDLGIESNATGQTAQMISNFRRAAKVGSFDEAASRCEKGKSGIAGKILEKPADSIAVKVQPNNGSSSFWSSEGFVVKK